MANKNPKVSVVVPCYNQGHFVMDAIRSVEKSDYADYELIIVNDGSTDPSTIQMMKELKTHGYQVLEQPNMGLSMARNNGIASCRGEYILPLDADNKIRPEYIREAVHVLDKMPDIGMVYGDRHFFGLKDKDERVPDFDLARLMIANYIDACAVFRKSLWADCGGYDADIRVGMEDWELWISAAKRNWRFFHIPQVLFEYRVRENSLLQLLSVSKNYIELRKHIYGKHSSFIHQVLGPSKISFTLRVLSFFSIKYFFINFRTVWKQYGRCRSAIDKSLERFEKIKLLSAPAKYLRQFSKIKNMSDALPRSRPSMKNTGSHHYNKLSKVLEIIQPYTMVDKKRLENIFSLAADVNKRKIPGDIVECGVCNGGTAALLAGFLLERPEGKIWLYDTFRGIPAAAAIDGTEAQKHTGDYRGSISKVREVFCKSKVPDSKVVFREGTFQETFKNEKPRAVSILHIDADWYESVLLSLETFYPLVSEGGVIILDDFGWWEGCRMAFYEFCKIKNLQPLLERCGSTQAFWIKGREHNRRA